MDSGQDGNGFVGANGSNQFGGAGVSGNLNNSQVQTPQGVVSSGNNVVAGGSGAVPTQPTIASGGGDIVLSSGEQKSGKGPKWVIGVIVGILVLVGIGVGVWWGTKNGGDRQKEDVKVEESGFADAEVDLLKLFEVDRELAKYDGDTLVSDYINGDDEIVAKIRSSLEELNGMTNNYVKNYVDENTNFVDLAEEIIGIIDKGGCNSKTVMQLNSCLFSGGQGEVFAGKKRELELSRQRAGYTIEMAKEWLSDYIREGRYYENNE